MEDILDIINGIGYDKFITALVGVVSVYAINTGKIKYKIKKEYDKKVIIGKAPILISNDSKDIFDFRTLDKEVVQDFKTFVLRLAKQPIFNKAVFFNNVKNLKFETVDFSKRNFFRKLVLKSTASSRGCYYSYNNFVKISKDYDRSTLFHELFHVASRILEDKKLYNGFRQKNNVGIGLNEGYTEHMVKKYFFDYKDVRDSYSYFLEREISLIIELIVGEQFMEKCYFNADLLSLTLELEKYNEKDNIYKFIGDLDFFTLYSDNKYVKDDELISKFESIKWFILTTCIKKFSDNEINVLMIEDWMDKLNDAMSIYISDEVVREEFLNRKVTSDYIKSAYKNYFCDKKNNNVL